jgi:hypothetical protein
VHTDHEYTYFKVRIKGHPRIAGVPLACKEAGLETACLYYCQLEGYIAS